MKNIRKSLFLLLFLAILNFLIFNLDYVKETNSIKVPSISTAFNLIEDNNIKAPGSLSSFYWRDNYGNYHSAKLSISNRLYKKSKRNGNAACSRLMNSYGNSWWSSLYVSLINHDDPLIPRSIFNEFEDILKNRYYTHKEFADVIVSCIQSMSYVIPNNNCEIYAPLELLRTQRGDCDSRTVLLATLLNRFGYDVIVINDKPNSHSMLAISIPHSGRYISFKGKRYYAWETTAKGWKPGMLPADYARWDMDSYWNTFVWFK